MDCWNVNHQQQQSFLELHLPGLSASIKEILLSMILQLNAHHGFREQN